MNEVIVEYPTDWAQIDDDGTVINVISAVREQIYARAGDGYLYVESSDDRPAIMGGRYFADTDTFAPSAPFESWSWNETDRIWEAPTPKPSEETWTQTFLDGFETERERWVWNEITLSWVDIRPA
jgi:hypothetical protein